MTEKPDKGYWDFIRERAKVAVDIIFAIFFDALIFCFWLFLTWGTSEFSEFMEKQGVSDILADIFKVCSSFATFILTISYIIIDICKSIKKILQEKNKN